MSRVLFAHIFLPSPQKAPKRFLLCSRSVLKASQEKWRSISCSISPRLVDFSYFSPSTGAGFTLSSSLVLISLGPVMAHFSKALTRGK